MNLTYRQEGDVLLPNVTLGEMETARPLGKYGRMRKRYLMEQRPLLYN
ncbi:MAG: TnpV protein, partial [Clostridia bacterium]|nr:TnpV protein [Clostridia bacterium]